MRTTVDVPDELYRQVKGRSSLEGLTVKEVTLALYRSWIEGGALAAPGAQPSVTRKPGTPPAWYGSLVGYARRRKGGADMEAMRASIAKGVARERGL